MNTLNSFLADTAFTLLFMTFFFGGMGIIGIRKAFKGKIIYSKKEFFKKGKDYSPLQTMLASIIFLLISLWYNLYEKNMFEYIDKVQLLLRKSEVNFELGAIGPILLGIFILIAMFGSSFSKDYADKRKDLYILEFNKYDKFGGLIALIMISIMIYDDYINIDEFYEKLIALTFLFLGIVIFLYTRIKILFNTEYIQFNTFLRRKKIILWVDVKSIRFEKNNNEYIRLTTKNNKKFIIPARFNGLVSFMSIYKIRNKSREIKGTVNTIQATQSLNKR